MTTDERDRLQAAVWYFMAPPAGDDYHTAMRLLCSVAGGGTPAASELLGLTPERALEHWRAATKTT